MPRANRVARPWCVSAVCVALVMSSCEKKSAPTPPPTKPVADSRKPEVAPTETEATSPASHKEAAAPDVAVAKPRRHSFIWIEAEEPASQSKSAGQGVSGWGNTEFMSAGKVFTLQIGNGEEAHKKLGGDGLVVAYEFDVADEGEYETWMRTGFEHIRSDVDWRLDGAAWKTSARAEQTSDLQEIQTWNEIAWVKLGRSTLAEGSHKLELRHMPQWKDDRGKKKPDRTMHYSDCFCIYKGEFRPNGKHQPGAEYKTDEDRAAAKQVYALGEYKSGGKRTSVDLTGAWEIAHWEEHEIEGRLEGAKELPDLDALHWYGITAPGDRDSLRHDMVFHHRYIYRTKVDVPASHKDRAFLLQFQNFNMIASVFVNGVNCGWSKAHSTEWDCDITEGVRPGKTNDLAIVFKDCYYAVRKDTRRGFNLPHAFLHGNQGVTMQMDMPVVWDTRTGILEPVSFTSVGTAYVEDVFAKPSVKKKELAVEITVANPTDGALNVEVTNEVVPAAGGPVALSFASTKKSVPAGGSAVLDLEKAWADPKLWWPDDPQLYNVLTKVLVGGRVVDTRLTRFGFREWDWSTHVFKLNGVKWIMWADTNYGASPQKFIEQCKTSGMNMFRYWSRSGWGGMTRRQVLDYLDEQGMPVRNSGVFDGEHAAYRLDPDNTALYDNWREQTAAWIKAERNHPCVFIWSIENEIAFINSWNLGRWKHCEPELRRCAAMVEKLDPTRPTMVDGGRCLMDNSMPVNGCHYNAFAGTALREYPDSAYTRDHWYAPTGTGHGKWPMVPNRPMLHGEIFYANGWTPARFAQIGGDRCFIGLAETWPARSLFAKMMSEGYRWAEVSAWHMWFGNADRGYWNSWQPVCVLARQWNWTFGSGSDVKRTLGVFNGTRHADPIEMAWQLVVDGRKVAGESKSYRVPPGEKQIVEIAFTAPAVKGRTECEFVMTCARGGEEVFRETKAVSIIVPDAGRAPRRGAASVVVLDPDGSAKARLKRRGVAFTEIASIEDAPREGACIVVGRNAVTSSTAADPTWKALAASGARLLVLEQDHPLHYHAVPADFEVTSNDGRIAFAEDLTHPVFSGLRQKDFFCWSGDHVAYRNCYRKATKGARSLVQCDADLNYSAVAECQLGEGMMLLCQMAVGEKLATDPVAARLFDQMVAYAAEYVPVRKETAVVAAAGSEAAKALAAVNLKYEPVTDPVRAISGSHGIAFVEATPANLAKLAADRAAVTKFTDAGGWLMLHGLTPEGLADYNTVVGFDHVLRPFAQERVVFSAPRDPLVSGLTLRDVVMDSGQKIFNWMSLKQPAADAFSHIVDYDEMGPFLKMPTPESLGKPKGNVGIDHWPKNLVNGFTADDAWVFAYMIILDRGDATKWTMELPREEELIELSIVFNVIYHKTTKIRLFFDDDPTPFEIATLPSHDRQTFRVEGKKAKRITIELAEWETSGRGNVLGIDNMWLKVKRSEKFIRTVTPLLNTGGLVRYDMGKGGIVLNQINYLAAEQNPINAEKKRTITKVLLKNLGAVFEGSRTVIVGANLKYTPVRIPANKHNAYATRGGKPAWFRHKHDISHLPASAGKFAGVTYKPLDFATSPVPSVVMLGGEGSSVKVDKVEGLPIGRKTDALFFLHTFNASGGAKRFDADQARRGRNRRPRPVVFKYVVRYADGTAADVPVVWNEGVGHWASKNVKALKGAMVGWSAPFGGDASGEKAVVYSLQWDNPKPDVRIDTIDLAYGPEGRRWGAPALFAITAADVIE